MRRNPKAVASKGDLLLSGVKNNGRLKIVYGKSVIKNEREYYLISKLDIFPCHYFGLHVLLSESSNMHVQTYQMKTLVPVYLYDLFSWSCFP